MKNEKSLEDKAVFIEQESTCEPNKCILRAVVSDISEQKGVEDEEIEKPELNASQKIYTQTFSISEENKKEVVLVEDMPEHMALMSGRKPKELEVVLDVTILLKDGLCLRFN